MPIQTAAAYRAQVLRAARKRAGLRQTDIARKAGVSHRTVWNLECEDYPGGFHVETQRKILRALGIPLDRRPELFF